MEQSDYKRIQRMAKSVTPFAVAKAAPLFATADTRRYIFVINKKYFKVKGKYTCP